MKTDARFVVEHRHPIFASRGNTRGDQCIRLSIGQARRDCPQLPRRVIESSAGTSVAALL